jgi:hypothetical protein
MGLYATNGSINVTVVNGSTRTGAVAADGSWNVILAPGGTFVGAYHPCGARYVTLSPGTFVPIQAPDGSLYVDDVNAPSKNTGQPVTVVSGTLHPSVGTLGSPMGLLISLTYAS